METLKQQNKTKRLQTALMVLGSITAATLLFGFLGLLGSSILHRHIGSTVEKDGLFIGTYLGYEAAEREAIQLIAYDVRRYPAKNHFHVRWKIGRFPDLLGDDTFDMRVMAYDRQERRFSQGDYGGGSSWNGVTEVILDQVAHAKNYDVRKKILTQANCWQMP